ncbi:protein mono-ADP-ribosyltransferase PARP3-like [Strongylocentrotus purpuratus]|uniref:WGR domain-containing protein n=1 Tax=Strongylocentrotus purpuratus TaxID=7668 RepID=A0A7M7P1F1_STRPU|nr:protein mono-ADP-ribosyltransferase PARP3-like [Strongylocentrotus purpuratus]
MPPKKRAASTKAGGKGAKAVKKEPDDGGLKAAVEKLKTADKGKKVTHTKDSLCSWPGTVVDDYDCMLNQTNIGHNNNKFYLIQLLESYSEYAVFTRWGRVVSNHLSMLNLRCVALRVIQCL